MKIEKGQIIAGQPVLRIRDFFKRNRYFELSDAALFFGLSDEEAKILCTAVTELGYCQERSVDQNIIDHENEKWYDLLPLGRSLALAKARPPIGRAKASQLMDEFIERVKEVNRNKKYAYKVKTVLLFGSYLRAEVEKLNDIDIAVEMEKRYSNPKRQEQVEQAYIDNAIRNGKRFRSFIDKLCFPETEVQKFLTNKLRYISLHPAHDAVLKSTKTKKIYPKPFIDRLVELIR